jgi:hypothetical protein
MIAYASSPNRSHAQLLMNPAKGVVDVMNRNRGDVVIELENALVSRLKRLIFIRIVRSEVMCKSGSTLQ